MANELNLYWDQIYSNKSPHPLSWPQEFPTASIQILKSLNLTVDSPIIDIGGGDSRFVDLLLEAGFKNLTVLDISEEALKRAKLRLQEKAKEVKWIVTDILDFEPSESYSLWHDRATFHFLSAPSDIHKYLGIAKKHTDQYLIIATFSETGPRYCSGLPVRNYSEADLIQELGTGFKKLNCIREDHKTPMGTLQNFIYCSFKKIS